MPLTFASPVAETRPIHLVGPDDLAVVLAGLPVHVASWVAAAGFTAAPGSVLAVPDADGAPLAAFVGLGDPARRDRDRFVLGGARAALPGGTWHLATPLDLHDRDEAALGWLLAGYSFTRYAKSAPPTAALVCPEGCDAAALEAIAAGEALTRDLINTPANDMGPAELEQAARDLARRFGAAVTVTGADDLVAAKLPLIHAVGRAAAPHRGPRLIDMSWGDAGPRLTLVGKGVCFDTGGLNLKPASSIGLMKKDMGGAAAVLGLAQTIMALGLRLRLRVLIPAVENVVSGDAMRPGDILPSRKGLTVEVNNTDAEGRLVLADAIALGVEGEPDLIVSMATLTGAARVAVGPDIAPFWTDDGTLAAAISAAGARVRDPVWRLPFWAPYETMIEPGIADLDNAPKGGQAGAITAALFLRRFAEGATRYVHFDIYGWQATAAPGRSKGGTGQGARALLAALPRVLSQ